MGYDTRARVALALTLGLAAPGCFSGSTVPRARAPEQVTEQSKCKIAASSENPLVTEWPASEKANLEARLREGGVVVSYSGCDLKLLPQCRVRGQYHWRRTTTSTDTLEIRDADELWAKLPLGAVSLEGELERAGRLAVTTTVAGQLELQDLDLREVEQNPACEGATHVVGALSVGAFKLRSGASVGARGGADVHGVGAKSSASSEENVMRAAGNAESCGEATDSAPHGECASPIQIFLRALPKTLLDRGPPGSVKVNFLSGVPGKEWDVVVGDREVCKTPCEKWVDPVMPYGMRTGAGFLQQDNVVDVPDLREIKDPGPLQIRAHPRDTGRLVGGIVGASFGGMGVMTGALLAALGCGNDERQGLCTAGLVSLGAGAVVTAGGVWLIVGSGSYAEVHTPSGKWEARVPSGAPHGVPSGLARGVPRGLGVGGQF